MEQYDLIVIGGGPGGYEAALEAAGRYGMKTALIEKEELGGTCLNHGCIPTKIWLHSAELFRSLREGEMTGVSAKSLSFDMEKLQLRKAEVTQRLRSGIEAMMKKEKIAVYKGRGRITGEHTVEILSGEAGGSEDSVTLGGRFVLVATGSEAFVPPVRGAHLPNVFTSDMLLEKRDGPFGHLLIIGGGVIGMEFASVYEALGSRVTVLEALPRIISNMDRELSQSLRMLLKKRGVDIHTDTTADEITKTPDGRLCCAYTEKGEKKEVCADGILICVGRRPYTEGLFAEGISVETDRGRICTDEDGRTSIPWIYAIGDVTGGVMLAHRASAQGRNAAARMNGAAPTVSGSVIPGCIFTNPEIASAGLTAEEAKTLGLEAESKKYLMTANGKSVLTSPERGFIKIVYERGTGKLLGAHLMCERATDLIAEFCDAIVNELTVKDLSRVIRPHPTFCEAVTELTRSCI